MPANRTANLHSISRSKLCLICRHSNQKQPRPANSSDPDKNSDKFLQIFYQCINVQPPTKFDKSAPPEFCTSCKKYLEEWDNLAIQVPLLIARAQRIQNTLTSRVLIALKSSPETVETDDEYLRGQLIKKFRPIVRLEKIQLGSSNQVVIHQPENSQPLTSEVSRISSNEESDQLKENGPKRRSNKLKKHGKISLKNNSSSKSDLSYDCYPKFNCDSVETVGPGEYKYERIPFTFKHGVFSCGSCCQNYRGPLGHAKSRILTHVTKFHSGDLPDWLERAGLDSSQVKFLQLGMYGFHERVPFSVQRNPSKRRGWHVSFKCQLCPQTLSGCLQNCWSQFTKHMYMTHISGAVIDPVSSCSDPQEAENSNPHDNDNNNNNNEMDKVLRRLEDSLEDLPAPQVKPNEFCETMSTGFDDNLNNNVQESNDLSQILSAGQVGYLCELCSVIYTKELDLRTHFDLVHSDVIKSEVEPGFEPMITQGDLFNEGENINDMKMDPLEIFGP